MYGARTSLIVGVVASVIAVLIGLVVGLTAGYFRGPTDTLLLACRRRDARDPAAPDLDRHRRGVQLEQGGLRRSATRSSPGCTLVIAIIVLFTWPYIARLVRGFTLSLREKEFVEASRSLGAEQHADHLPRDPAEPGRPDHRLHDAADPAEHPLRGRALVPRPRRAAADTASWGGLLNDAQRFYDTAWWLMLFPGLMLVITTLAFNLLGDGLRDALDVRGDR